MISIRKLREADKSEIWQIIKYVISKGDSFTYAPDVSREDALEDWVSSDKHAFVAVDENEKILGTFYIKANQTGLGSHIANGSYMVAPEARRKGVGRLMGEYSIEEAKRLGFHAMQFNFVVKSNEKAVNLWKSLGFEIIGEIPDAYRHLENGLTNAYIMYRKL
jgi:ribosomal protein S18 acetylase RimI-like enzyme